MSFNIHQRSTSTLTHTLRIFVLPLFLFVADFSEVAGPQSVAGETRVGGRVVHSHSVRRHSRLGNGRRSSAPDLYKSRDHRWQLCDGYVT